jgi:hypothetical protein
MRRDPGVLCGLRLVKTTKSRAVAEGQVVKSLKPMWDDGEVHMEFPTHVVVGVQLRVAT